MCRKGSGAKGLWAARVLFASCCIWLFLSSAAYPQTPQEQAKVILQTGVSEHNTGKRAAAVAALGLLQNDPWAIESAEKARPLYAPLPPPPWVRWEREPSLPC